MISNFKAQNYTGDFEVVEGNYTITGTFNADASKTMLGGNGTVRDNEDKVLCCTKTKKGFYNLVIGYYMGAHGWACGMNSNVIAWMPLPEPYTGGES